MTLHTETVTDTMMAVAKVIFNMLDEAYYLAGGTALALRLGHRKSVDLDYFIKKDTDTLFLKNKITEMFPAATVLFPFEEKNTLWCSINGVNVSFISRSDTLLEPVEVIENFRIVGVKDITVMKLSAICSREEYKDYFDLACLANITDAREWIGWWQKVYTHADYTSFVVALGDANTISPVSLDIFDTYKNVAVPKILSQATKEITAYLNL